MHERFHVRPAVCLTVAGTLGAMAAVLALAAPGGATGAEKAYEASAPITCVLGPGVLEAKESATLQMRFKGPEAVQEAESGIELTESSASITLPAEASNSFHALGASSARGQLESLVVNAANMEPAELDIAHETPWEAPVREGNPLALRFPHEGTFAFGPYTVTGKQGESAILRLSTEPGFNETSEGFRATGSGIDFTVEGVNEKGEKTIGPLTVACNAPGAVALWQAPIATSPPPPPTCTYTSRSLVHLTLEPSHGPASGGTVVTIRGADVGEAGPTVDFGGTAVADEKLETGSALRVHAPPGHGTVSVEVNGPATPCPSQQYGAIGYYTYEPPVETAAYNGWAVAGSITDRRLGDQAIALPEGSTFTGAGEVDSETGKGQVTGSFAVPPFTAPVKLFGVIPVGIGMTLTQAAPATGTVSPSESVAGDEALGLPVKLDLGVTSVSLLGLKIPAQCAGTEPLSLSLTDTLSREALLKSGWSFAGTTTVPAIRCEGGLLGRLFGAVLTGLLSGPENGYALTVSAPGA